MNALRACFIYLPNLTVFCWALQSICPALPGDNPRGCPVCICPSGLTCDESDGVCKASASVGGRHHRPIALLVLTGESLHMRVCPRALQHERSTAARLGDGGGTHNVLTNVLTWVLAHAGCCHVFTALAEALTHRVFRAPCRHGRPQNVCSGNIAAGIPGCFGGNVCTCPAGTFCDSRDGVCKVRWQRNTCLCYLAVAMLLLSLPRCGPSTC